MRRSILFLALVVTSIGAVACADSATAPAPRAVAPQHANLDCISGYQTGTGDKCGDSL